MDMENIVFCMLKLRRIVIGCIGEDIIKGLGKWLVSKVFFL